jgi:hypothetical protein
MRSVFPARRKIAQAHFDISFNKPAFDYYLSKFLIASITLSISAVSLTS